MSELPPRFLHFGAGTNQLPEPWENFDVEVNIAKPLPVLSGSARFVVAEHVIEHVEFRAGFAFLRECRRVLEPGGVLRLSFPDVARLTDARMEYYRRKVQPDELTRAQAYGLIFTGWGHRAAWTRDVALAALESVGFERSSLQLLSYGVSDRSELSSVDGHHMSLRHLAVPEACIVCAAETTTIEATK